MTPAETVKAGRAALRRMPAGPARTAERDRLVALACDAADEALRRAPREAVAWARAAVALLRARGAGEPGDTLAWRADRGLAKALHAAGDVLPALEQLESLAVRTSDRRRLADVHSTRAILLARAGRFPESSRAATRARALFRSLGDGAGVAHVDVNEANALHRRDEHAKARPLYLRALKALERAGRREDAAAALVGLGNVGTFLGRLREADEAYRRAEDLFRAAGREHARLVAAYNRAYLAVMEGRAQAALDALDGVAAGFRSIGDRRAVANCELDRAEVLGFLRCWPEARSAAAAARASCEELGLGLEAARASLVLARAASALGEPKAFVAQVLRTARDEFQAQQHAVGADLARVLEAEALRRAGRPEDAARLARGAATRLQARRQPSRAAAARLAEAESLRACGASGAARRAAAVAQSLRGAGDWARLEAEALLAELALQAGDVAAARRLGSHATALLARLSEGLAADGARLALASDMQRAPRVAIAAELAGPRPRVAKALALAEQARRFGLLEGSRRRAASELAAWAAARTADTTPAVRTRGLRRGSPATAAAVTSPRAAGQDFPLLEASGVLRRLAPGDALVELVTWPDAEGRQTLALVAAERRLRAVRLPAFPWDEACAALHDAAERAAVARALAPAALPAAEAALERALARIAEAVLEPLRDVIAPARRLLVAPSGTAASLPWGALPWDGSRLGAHVPVTVLPAASWLARAEAPGPAGPLVAIGCSDEAAPGIDDEVRAVGRIAGAVARSGSAATVAELARLAPGAGILHVAAHGAFRADAPERSALRLADRWVSASELEELPLRARLVALSACQAGGASASGAQSLGLVRALLRAGARRVAVTPWSVPDDLARDLWPRVHARIAAGAGVAASLRDAQSECPSEGALPWSFTLHGKP